MRKPSPSSPIRCSTGPGHRPVDEPGVAGADAELPVERPGRESGHPTLQQERGHALVPLRAVDGGEHEEVVGDIREADPELRAIEDVALAIATGGGREVARVGADARLGQPERGELLALRLGHQPALPLLLGAPLQEGQRVQPDVDALDDPERRVGPLELLAQHREADVVHARAAVALGDRRAQEPELGHAAEDLAVDLALASHSRMCGMISASANTARRRGRARSRRSA